ncbi:MAG: DUF3471 domain-containing protein [Saprospiraceae bacterium]|nr:DUF3471 domain-containing protein [Saprospiraceae bacterium]
MPETKVDEEQEKPIEKKEIKLSDKVLNKYTGTYKLGPAWYVHITLKDGQLTLGHFRNGNISLLPAWNDDFRAPEWYASTVEFKRDKNDQVIGLYISQYRSMKQFFKKMDSDFNEVND